MSGSERFSVKFFSEFLHTPRPIASIPGIGQISMQQMILSLGIGLLVGGLCNLLFGPVIFFLSFLLSSLSSVLILSKEQDHIKIGERIMAAIVYQMRRRIAPEELLFIPSDEAFSTTDMDAHRPVLLMDENNQVMSMHHGGRR
ncbi:hypothetical protein [Herpetosiphon geysericola]|uniref:Uncharacterized protein n=1 Tax=Herpetosiphon geysericola TaxID=70996 RepID=A0A0P6YD73_9CHLR|nr:hypothetical protein [Herpetosiphon geysericola]KPL79957.1 hypothetical protein SE18_25545 [Herpetosiphon geysericola]